MRFILKGFSKVYPIYLLLERNEDFEICCNESQLEKFEDAKKRFEKSYETNIEFRNTYGVMNSTVNIADKFSSNGTLYAVMNLDEGTDYQNYTDRSLVEILSHIKALATVINKYHSDGCQYLKKSKIAIDINSAKSRGYTPCSRCNP